MEGLEFPLCEGHFHFHQGNMRLELWEEFCSNPQEGEERLWLVYSGDRVGFNTEAFNEKMVFFKDIEAFCAWLNEELVNKKWKDIKELDVWGKILFWDDLNHDIVVAILWRNGAFQIKTHKFL